MLDSLENLLEELIKDLYSAEKQLVKGLPRMVKASTNDELKEAFTSHLEETRDQVRRLEQVAKLIGAKPSGKHCKGMEGLIEEAKEILEEDGSDSVIDSGLIGAAQKVEHYEIAAYGTARAIAEELGLTEVVELLQQTLDEEAAADKTLTAISEGGLLVEAGSSSDEDEEQDEDERPAKSKSRRRRSVSNRN